MISSEVQRTLVKSPPELWAELSDAESLARHLRELGEVRIVRTEPESTVEWAAEDIAGTVSIKPSGWGTKVTLSASRQFAGAQTPAEPQVVKVEDEPHTVEVEEGPEAVEVEDCPDAVATTELDYEPAPRRGFFARLFGSRRTKRTKRAEPPRAEPHRPEPPRADVFAAVTQALATETVATHHSFAAPEPRPAPPAAAQGPPEVDTASEQPPDISAELASAELLAAEELAAEEITAALTAVLDRLGAAHHRPFSRA